VTAGVILFNGREFVDAPKLVQKEKMDWMCACGKQLRPTDFSSSSSSHSSSSSYPRDQRAWSLYWLLSQRREEEEGEGGVRERPGVWCRAVKHTGTRSTLACCCPHH
jgi:hypothetical protein